MYKQIANSMSRYHTCFRKVVADILVGIMIQLHTVCSKSVRNRVIPPKVRASEKSREIEKGWDLDTGYVKILEIWRDRER